MASLPWVEALQVSSPLSDPSLLPRLILPPASHLLLGPHVCFITSLYLNVVNAWTLFYLGQSFYSPVPWEKCPLLGNSSDFGEEEAKEEEKGKQLEGNLEEEKGVKRVREEENSRKRRNGRGKE